mgnify:CR=1 FL=1
MKNKIRKAPKNSAVLIVPTFIGAVIGANSAINIPDETLTKVIGYLMIFMLGIVLLKPKRWFIETVSRENNKSILNLSQLTSNDPSACTGSTTNDPVYTNNIILNSQIKSKHNSQANSSNSSFNNSSGWLCFKQDGTSSGGGFEIENSSNKFRLNIWQTGFYESTKFINNQWKEYN